MSEMPTNEVGGESFTAYIERLGVTLAPTGNPNLSRELFEANDAQHFIDSFSVYQGDRLNIFTTAKQLGVSLDYGLTVEAMHMGQTTGLALTEGSQGLRISLRPNLGFNTAVTFGHEVGHIFLEKIIGQVWDGCKPEEEVFCSYFGRAMAINERFLQDLEAPSKDDLVDLMAKHRVMLDDVVYRLMESGALPSKIAVDTYASKFSSPVYSEKIQRIILCLHCLESDGDINCEPAAYEIPIIDFTDRDWSGQLNTCCGQDGDARNDIGLINLLTEEYQAQEIQPPLFRSLHDYSEI